MFKWLRKMVGLTQRDELIKEQQGTIQVLVIYLGALILNKHGTKVKIDYPFIEMMVNNENLVIDDKLLSDKSMEISVKDLSGEFDDNQE